MLGVPNCRDRASLSEHTCLIHPTFEVQCALTKYGACTTEYTFAGVVAERVHPIDRVEYLLDATEVAVCIAQIEIFKAMQGYRFSNTGLRNWGIAKQQRQTVRGTGRPQFSAANEPGAIACGSSVLE